MAKQTELGLNERTAQRDRTTDIINEIAALRGDLADCRQAIGQMQVRMDTGALVGAISAPMDTALGKKALRNGRGVR